MAFCGNHNRIYFDALNRAKKAETILSLIYATYQTKLNKDNLQKSEKEIIAEKLKYAYELFKFDVGTYDGNVNSFDSQYTIGHEMGIWINSDLDLSPLATKVAEGYMTIKDYLSVVFLNYIQPVNGKILHVLHCLLTYMNNNKLSSITKEQMADAYNSFIPDSAPQASVNAVFNYMIATNYFNQTGKQELTFNSKYDIKNIINLCDVTYLDETKYTYEQVKEKFKDLKVYLEYLLNEHIDEKIVKDDFDKDTFLILEDEAKENYTIEELGQILRGMYDNASGNKSATIHVFGILYGEIIKKNEYNATQIVKASGLSEDYRTVLTRALSAYDYIKNGEYGIRFYESNATISNYEYQNNCEDGINKIFYGVPGCGKSHYIENKVLKDLNIKEENKIRTTFYQDYSNTDFVGQILPKITGEKVEYIFNPGPFTLALIQAYKNPQENIALVIEEINRGNAPAIFGDIFQLLDRKKGVSEYGIKNVQIIDYLNSYNLGNDSEKLYYHFDEIKIPGNLYIYATMNTSDQNVYTLDTAFTRRWEKEKIPNEFSNDEDNEYFKKRYVPGTNMLWKIFATAINNHISDNLDNLQVNEDKLVGAYFINDSALSVEENIHTRTNHDDDNLKLNFAHKVLDYLWSDVAKLDHNIIFKSITKDNKKINTLDSLIDEFKRNGLNVFQDSVFKNMDKNDLVIDGNEGTDTIDERIATNE